MFAWYVCGYKFVYRGRRGELNGRFCSMRCQDWYDPGNEPVSDEIVYRWRDGRPMRMGLKGFYIDCEHCQKEFETTLLLGQMRARLQQTSEQSSRHG